ncbi:hypothetical protein EQG68_11215 [Flavobacterium piscinae]|uniref:Lipocalin-like domain-containing protein n=2 Tax=Flavobacterium piscinae TaxID=2506424 RepID=A0A4Q1KL39_9FLAO|nr:lipocalin family protein [Flavobacterium piscinae]RXR30623.1 hypothetical protein EQG68_11215 [Flavobacterium piscinae]
MKPFYYFLLFSVALISCQEKVSPESISKINGYWEIQKVQLPDGQEKEYNINETVDYIEWNGKTGYRKKVKPQFDGKFLTNDELESIQIKDSSGVFQIHYKTNFAQWSEDILVLTDSILVLKNRQNLEYHYKRFKPITIQ